LAFLGLRQLGYFFPELGEIFSPIFCSPCSRQAFLTFGIFSIGAQLLPTFLAWDCLGYFFQELGELFSIFGHPVADRQF
jgi:hypothetical protein